MGNIEGVEPREGLVRAIYWAPSRVMGLEFAGTAVLERITAAVGVLPVYDDEAKFRAEHPDDDGIMFVAAMRQVNSHVEREVEKAAGPEDASRSAEGVE